MAWDASSLIVASSVVSASGNTTAVDPEGAEADRGVVLFQLWVGTVTGTSPTLQVYIEESSDNSSFFEVCKFSKVNASGTASIINATKTTTDQYQAVGIVTRRYIRARYVVGGSASPTFNGVIIHSRALGIDVPSIPAGT